MINKIFYISFCLLLICPLASEAIQTSLDDPNNIVSGIVSDPEVYIIQIDSTIDPTSLGSVSLQNSKTGDVLSGEFIPPNRYFFRGISDGVWSVITEETPKKIEDQVSVNQNSSSTSSTSGQKAIQAIE